MAAIQVTVPAQILLRLMIAGQLSENVALPSIGNSSLVTAENETTESRSLPSGYVPFPEYGVAYKFFQSEVTYNEAMSLCVGRKGQLAVIDSIEKVEKILNNFCIPNWAWVGLILPFGTGGWTTTNGTPRVNLPWAFGSPDGSRRCVCVARDNNGLRTAECRSKKSYFCEFALPWN